MLYTSEGRLDLARAQIVAQNLEKIGLDVEVKRISGYFDRLPFPGEPFDIAMHIWLADYVDPYNYINLLFDRRFVGATNFTRFVSSSQYDQEMRRAARLPQGSDRNDAYAALDVRLARDAAPMAAVDFLNEPTLVSKRVGCMVLRPVLDLTAVCLER